MRLPLLFLLLLVIPCFAQGPQSLPGTAPLTDTGDLSAQMVEGISHWLERETTRITTERHREWRELDAKSLPDKAAVLRKILGVTSPALTLGRWEEIRETGDERLAQGNSVWAATRVRWPSNQGIWGEGLLLRPRGEARAFVIAIPDADQTPEQISGFEPGVPPEAQFARRIADQGCLVLVPHLVSRNPSRPHPSSGPFANRVKTQPHREWLYRQGFELGRTLAGFEIEKVLTALAQAPRRAGLRIGIAGYGEGGMIALHAAALSGYPHPTPESVVKVDATLVSGYFSPREWLWSEPIDRNRFGYLRAFGDAEVAAMIAPGTLVIEHSVVPNVPGAPPSTPARKSGTPGKLTTPTKSAVESEWNHAVELRSHFGKAASITAPAKLIKGSADDALPLNMSDGALDAFLHGLGLGTAPLATPAPPAAAPQVRDIATDAREARAGWEVENFLQRELVSSDAGRFTANLWKKVVPGPEYTAIQAAEREHFWKDVMGKLPGDYLPPNVRTRQILDREKWTAYEVKLDVQTDVFAWGILLLPKDLKPGERRPVVVCQHGLEGLPMDTINDDQKERAWTIYKSFAAQLAEQGFITYAPHNPYRGQDRFRELQRRANPLGLSLFSFINAQHDVLTRWLASLPSVDPARIGFYGLSYGGKTAMRVPAVIDRYCLSICSGDFNEWVRKNASTDYPSSYLFSGEYEIFEWDLAHTFNYSDMAMLIAPRPFMVERGHGDGVAVDEWVGFEFAKVKRGYDRLGVGDRTELEWFDGPHTIHGVGTFDFLRRHLAWPAAK